MENKSFISIQRLLVLRLNPGRLLQLQQDEVVGAPLHSNPCLLPAASLRTHPSFLFLTGKKERKKAAPVTEAEAWGAMFGMRRFLAANGEAPGVGPAGLRGGEGCQGGGEWSGFTKGHSVLSSQEDRSDVEENNGDGSTLLDLLFEFMHRSNDTKREKKKTTNKGKGGNLGEKQPHHIPHQHPPASSTKKQPCMSLARTGKQEKRKKNNVFLQRARSRCFFFQSLEGPREELRRTGTQGHRMKFPFETFKPHTA